MNLGLFLNEFNGLNVVLVFVLTDDWYLYNFNPQIELGTMCVPFQAKVQFFYLI